MSQHRVCLNMIVRDEAATMPNLLDSVRGFVDYYVIVDTGSTDGTQEVIRNHTRGWLEGEVHDRVWVDYATNRNQALDLARASGSKWAFFIDADDELVGEKTVTLEDGFSYYLAKRGDGFQWTLPSVVWLENDWKWQAPVHEVLVATNAKLVYLENPWIKYNTRVGFRTRQENKFLRDAEVLEKAVRDNPNDARCWFYLGQSYLNAQVFDKALGAYERRTQLVVGWDEERCVSHVMKARIRHVFGHPFDEVLREYLAAHEVSPRRAEPLHGIAALYRVVRQNFEAAYPFALQAATKNADPSFLFAEMEVYTYKALEEFLLASYYTNRQVDCQNACAALQQRIPHIAEKDRPRIIDNLRFGEMLTPTWQAIG